MSNYYNEAGEPLMDGAAMRYEMYIDSMYEPDPDEYYDSYDEGDYDECPNCDDEGMDPQSGECAYCGYTMGDEPDVPEDQWLDSYMEDRLTTMFE
jgi:hypothetical protein